MHAEENMQTSRESLPKQAHESVMLGAGNHVRPPAAAVLPAVPVLHRHSVPGLCRFHASGELCPTGFAELPSLNPSGHLNVLVI